MIFDNAATPGGQGLKSKPKSTFQILGFYAKILGETHLLTNFYFTYCKVTARVTPNFKLLPLQMTSTDYSCAQSQTRTAHRVVHWLPQRSRGVGVPLHRVVVGVMSPSSGATQEKSQLPTCSELMGLLGERGQS